MVASLSSLWLPFLYNLARIHCNLPSATILSTTFGHFNTSLSMGDWARGWTRVGQTGPTQHYGRVWEAERELEELSIIDSWNNDDSWPGM